MHKESSLKTGCFGIRRLQPKPNQKLEDGILNLFIGRKGNCVSVGLACLLRSKRAAVSRCTAHEASKRWQFPLAIQWRWSFLVRLLAGFRWASRFSSYPFRVEGEPKRAKKRFWCFGKVPDIPRMFFCFTRRASRWPSANPLF